jgi:hypothetical protein
VRAAHSEAVARCVSGVPRFSGRSAVASASVNGLELGLDRATTEVVRLIDSQSIDPSDIDIAQVLPPGAEPRSRRWCSRSSTRCRTSRSRPRSRG